MSGAAAEPTRPCPPARLRLRADFVRASAGRRVHSRSFSLQAARRGDDDQGAPRVGLTVTRKVGGAVERNRIKRRLREALRADLAAEPGHDFVVVARREALATPFAALVAELRRCFVDHKAGRSKRSGPSRTPGGSPASGGARPPSPKMPAARARGPAARDARQDPSPRDVP